MRIPIDELAPDTLYRVVEHVVLREGSDYGAEEYSLADKVEQVLAQLRQGTAVLVSDGEDTLNILPLQQWRGLRQP